MTLRVVGTLIEKWYKKGTHSQSARVRKKGTLSLLIKGAESSLRKSKESVGLDHQPAGDIPQVFFQKSRGSPKGRDGEADLAASQHVATWLK